MQAPKTREELIALYGYDIQAADKPPEMPPRKLGRQVLLKVLKDSNISSLKCFHLEYVYCPKC